jgi:hypothetical protein
VVYLQPRRDPHSTSHHRLVALDDGHVGFRYTDYRAPSHQKTLSLDAMELIGPNSVDPLALAEPVVVNCAGLGAGALFGDSEIEPVRGQLVFLQPDDRVDYLTVGSGSDPLPQGNAKTGAPSLAD